MLTNDENRSVFLYDFNLVDENKNLPENMCKGKFDYCNISCVLYNLSNLFEFDDEAVAGKNIVSKMKTKLQMENKKI